jgi:hypothetical protein
MTIRRGEPWGVEVERPRDLRVVGDDAGLATEVDAGASGPLAVSGGDLYRALGSPGDRPVMQRVTIDLLRVTADERRLTAVAHVVARRSWWRGPIVAALNVDHIGSWNVAPRAHPNDGRLDVVEVEATMSRRQRWSARSRLPHGTHVPHPSITARAATEVVWRFERPVDLWLDGVRSGTVRRLEVSIEPDAFDLHV